jgi:hypothetical protein
MMSLSTRLSTLLEELAELPTGLSTPVAAGLLIGDVLRAVGYDDAAIAAAVGVDLAALEDATAAVMA